MSLHASDTWSFSQHVLGRSLNELVIEWIKQDAEVLRQRSQSAVREPTKPIINVPIADIIVPQLRVRSKAHDPESLASSMAEVGLINPVTLTSGLRLIGGRHRLEAAKHLGWTHIEARLMDVDELEAELLEIDENLKRHDLTVVEEATHYKRREEVPEEKGERAKPYGNGSNQHGSKGATVAPLQTNEDLAAELSISKRTYQYRIRIAEGLSPDTVKLLISVDDLEACSLPNATRQLLYLADMENKDWQLRVARRVVEGRAENVQQAERDLRGDSSMLRVETYKTPGEREQEEALAPFDYDLKPVIKRAAKAQAEALGEEVTPHLIERVGKVLEEAATTGRVSLGDGASLTLGAAPITGSGGWGAHLKVLSAESVEWYTPPAYIEAARDLMGGIDLDPASNETAQGVIQAATYYTKETNGLDKEWRGRVWLNPPYGNLCPPFVAKCLEEFGGGNVTEAVLLLNGNSFETSWFAPLWDHTLCFSRGRINFYGNDGEASGSTHGSCFIYLGPQVKRFLDLFEPFGHVVLKGRKVYKHL